MLLTGMEELFDDESAKYDKDEMRGLIESLQEEIYSPPPAASIVQRPGEEVALFTLGLLEIGYRFGGKNPEAGLDCSGMVSYVYAEAINKEMRGSRRRYC